MKSVLTVHDERWQARRRRQIDAYEKSGRFYCGDSREDVIELFPSLAGRDFSVVQAGNRLNCHAVTFDQDDWFSAGGPVWFSDVILSDHISAWRETLRRLGYSETPLRAYRSGLIQVAIYALSDGYVTHSARMIGQGIWESKQGRGPIISGHALEDLNDKLYGAPRYFFAKELAA